MIIYKIVGYEDIPWGEDWIQAYFLDKQKAEAALVDYTSAAEYPYIYTLKEVEVIE